MSITAIMEDAHAFSSPSSSKQSEACPAAPFRKKAAQRRNTFVLNYIGYRRPNVAAAFAQDNAAADSGTFLHGQMEGLLKDGIPMSIEDPYELSCMEEICAELKAKMDVAEQYGIEDKLFNDGVASFGSADFWAIIVEASTDENDNHVETKTLHVDDLKTGYVQVDAEGNTQALRYACGVMEKLDWPEDIELIRVGILSFRFPASSWTVTRAELLDYWLNTFRPSMLANNRLNPVAVPGDHCKYCDAIPHCAEFWQHIDKGLPKETFDTDFKELDTETLERLYLTAQQAADATKSLYAELILRSEVDTDFGQEGGLSLLKVKQGNSRSFYSDEKAVEDLVKTTLGDKAYAKPKLVGASALKKLVKDDPELVKQVEDLIVTTNNKPSLIKN